MTAAKQIELVSIDAYLADELVSNVKHEYSDGFVYAMAGAKNVHNQIGIALLGSLYAQLRGKPC